MLAKNKKYSKTELLSVLATLSNKELKELQALADGLEIFSVTSQKSSNSLNAPLTIESTRGAFFENAIGNKLTHHHSQQNQPFRNATTGGKPGNFGRGVNNQQQKSGESRNESNQKDSIRVTRKAPSTTSNEKIPVFQQCGFASDSTSEVWYYRNVESSVQGPLSSIQMDELLEKGKINFETRVVISDPSGKFIGIKKLITHTFGDKYAAVLNKAVSDVIAAPVSSKIQRAPEQHVANEVKEVQKTIVAPIIVKEEEAEVIEEVKPQTAVASSEGFQVVPKKSTNKKFDKKNATKIIIMGMSEAEIAAEAHKQREQELKSREILQQKIIQEQLKQQQEAAAPSKSTSFPNLGESTDNSWQVADKFGKTKKNNVLEVDSKLSSTDNGQAAMKAAQKAAIEKERLRKQQEAEEFQAAAYAELRRPVYDETSYHDEIKPLLVPNNEELFPSLLTSVYNGPPKNDHKQIQQPQQQQGQGQGAKRSGKTGQNNFSGNQLKHQSYNKPAQKPLQNVKLSKEEFPEW